MCSWEPPWWWVNIKTLRPKQNCRHFTDDIFKCILLNENVWISFKISLKFVPKVLMNNIPVLVQIMAWHRPGNKPLSRPMMVRLPTHICATRPQWVNSANGLLLGWPNVDQDTQCHRASQDPKKSTVNKPANPEIISFNFYKIITLSCSKYFVRTRHGF